MDLTRLEEIIGKEPSFRKKQVNLAVFEELIETWSLAKTLPLSLREVLDKECPLFINAQANISKDSVKAVVELDDKARIETVLMMHKDARNTVCVSSQAGCPLGCSFCATGRSFKRNLNVWEIVQQVLFFARFLKPKRVTNVVFMGMGEPFLNYDNVIEAIKIINNDLKIGARHISISTVGIVEGIEKLAKENMQINLAVSLHAPNDKLRSSLMKVNNKYPISMVLKAVDEYIEKTKRKVMIEYILIKDVNDSDLCAKELAALIKKPLYFVNLISYNPTGIFSPSDRIKAFKKILDDKGLPVVIRHRFGRNIKAACGQLE